LTPVLNEKKKKREPNDNIPLVWAQSLMLLGDLLLNQILTVEEIDPVGRRLKPVKEQFYPLLLFFSFLFLFFFFFHFLYFCH